MPPLINMVLFLLAITRVTTLITHDEISRPIRAWLVSRFNAWSRTHRALLYALGEPDADDTGCPWCISVWVGAAGSPIMLMWGDRLWVLVPVVALAASQITGMIYQWGRSA